MGCSLSDSSIEPQNPIRLQLYLQSAERKRKRRNKFKKGQKKVDKLKKKYLKNLEKQNEQTNIKITKSGTCNPNDILRRHSNTFHHHQQVAQCEMNKTEYDRFIESELRHQLDDDLCLFLLNQISWTLQIFANFESEYNDVITQLLVKEKELNKGLDDYSVSLGNPIDALVNKWIQFQSTNNCKKNTQTPLRRQTIYIIFENIEVVDPNEAPTAHDSITPSCKVIIESDYFKTTPTKYRFIELMRANKWKGYVRLKVSESSKVNHQSISKQSEHEDCMDPKSGYSTISEQTETDNSMISKTTLGININPKSLTSGSEFQLENQILLQTCFSKLSQFIESGIEKDSDEDEDEDSETSSENGGDREADVSLEDYRSHDMRAINKYKSEQEQKFQQLQQLYLNSNEFENVFKKLMCNELAENLQVEPQELSEAIYAAGTIYTNHHQFIPALRFSCNAKNWPDSAFSFLRRERPICKNPKTGENRQWPTRAMLQHIQTLGCHLIPVGFKPKSENNPFRHLEWRITFPKAEWYLQRNLTRPQMKLFIICQALVKTFVEPEAQDINELALTVDFLRTHLLWECERNCYAAWASEEFLGEVLLEFLKSFLKCLRRKKLNDFFIEEHNVFETVSDFALQRLNQILSEVVENPLMHLLLALRNLHFAHDFYPKQNFQKLYDNLKEGDIMNLRIMSKNARHSLLPMTDIISEDNSIVSETSKRLQGLEINELRNSHVKTKVKLRRRTQALRHSIGVAKELAKSQNSIEPIDVEFFFNQREPTNEGIENLRRTNILELLLDHLLATVEKAIDFRSFEIASMLLSQADRLCNFYGDYGCDLGEQKYRSTIRILQRSIFFETKSPYPEMVLRTTQAEVSKSSRCTCRSLPRASKDDSSVSQQNTFKIVKKLQNKTEASESSDESGSPTITAKKINIITAQVHATDASSLKKSRGYSPILIRSHGKAYPVSESTTKNAPQTKEDHTEKICSEGLEEKIMDFKSSRKSLCVDFSMENNLKYIKYASQTKDRIERKSSQQLQEKVIDFETSKNSVCKDFPIQNDPNDIGLQYTDGENGNTCKNQSTTSANSTLKSSEKQTDSAKVLNAIKNFISTDTLITVSSVRNVLPTKVWDEKRMQEICEKMKMKTGWLKSILKDS